jgi:hypothetical protein
MWTAVTALAFGATGWLLGQVGGGWLALDRSAVHDAAPAPRVAPAPSPALAAAPTEPAPMDADHGMQADRLEALLQAQGDVEALARQERDAAPQQLAVTMH